jgi:hypothetical protein
MRVIAPLTPYHAETLDSTQAPTLRPLLSSSYAVRRNQDSAVISLRARGSSGCLSGMLIHCTHARVRGGKITYCEIDGHAGSDASYTSFAAFRLSQLHGLCNTFASNYDEGERKGYTRSLRQPVYIKSDLNIAPSSAPCTSPTAAATHHLRQIHDRINRRRSLPFPCSCTSGASSTSGGPDRTQKKKPSNTRPAPTGNASLSAS